MTIPHPPVDQQHPSYFRYQNLNHQMITKNLHSPIKTKYKLKNAKRLDKMSDAFPPSFPPKTQLLKSFLPGIPTLFVLIKQLSLKFKFVHISFITNHLMEKGQPQKQEPAPQKEEEKVEKNEAGTEGEPKKSKKQQNRQEKQKRLEAEKAEKAAKKAKEEEGKEKKVKPEEILDPTAYFENRSKMVNDLKKDPKTYPYPHKFHVETTIHKFIQKYSPITQKSKWLQEQVSLAARVTNIRRQGKKLVFYDLKQEGERLQVMCNQNNNKVDRNFEELHSTIRRGDIIGVVGFPGRTATQELSIAALEVKLLSPCLHMLPDAHTGFKDRESRYRKRYLDMIMNNKSRETFIMRSKVVSYVRNYLTKMDFVEVQTPMMNMIPGGATARPFVTHHNDLDMKLYMRIAPELFLKECVVGGLERVFEIGKNFRNESIDQTHNPQYTACQFYMAYADFHDLMNLTEDMLSSMVKDLTGSYIIKYHPDPQAHPDQTIDIDFSPPWKRISMMQGLQKQLGVPLPKDLESKEAQIFFNEQCIKHNVDCSYPRTTIRMVDKLVGRFLETQCLNPTFIIEHPQVMSPLAKYHRSKPGLTQRFELFIKYHEFCNAYTELNDPFVQKDLFLGQVKEKEKGDDQSMFYDQVFVNALEHALPPTAGWGLGIDRTVMLLTDQVRIQEVLLFPAMKPEEKAKEEKKVEGKEEQKPQPKVEQAPKKE